MVVEAEKAGIVLKENGISAEIIDLRSLRPLDMDTILNSVRKTGRLVVIDDKSKTHYIHDGYAPGDENKLKEVLDKLTVAKK